ncbi:MAG: ParA family protein [Alphaproteobacteria bacterium]|nr:ParA family protein [Alphaproteobacteria bacterium]
MTSIAVMNAKGGVGKSTLTMAIAETLAEHHGKSSLIIDSDGQMSVSLMVAPGKILADRADAQLTIVNYFVQKVLQGHHDVDWPQYVCRDVSDVDDVGGMFLIQGDMDLPLLEREIAATNKFADMRTAARQLLDAAGQYVDVILVDCAPGISVMTETWLRECDQHLIPVKPDFLAISGLEYLRRFRSRNPEMGFAAPLGVVINMMENSSPADRAMSEHLREDEALRCFATAIPMATIIQRAALYSAPKRSYMAKYAGEPGHAIRAVTRELLDRLKPPPPKPAGSAGPESNDR